MNELTDTVHYLHERVTRRPRVMLILGSGLGRLADALEEPVRISFADIPGFAPTTISGHGGALVAGRLEGVECVALQGRVHVYEGHSQAFVVLPLRAMAALGARTLIVTNAAGGLDPTFRPGDLMVLADHINVLWRNPLIGPLVPGDERFPDMSRPYDPALQELAIQTAHDRRIRARRGVYCAVSGPSYETPAEIHMLRRWGADAVGMSTVPEVLVARALGIRVLGISLISNLAAGLVGRPLSHEEVVAAGEDAADRFASLVRGVLQEIGTMPDVEVT